MPARAQRYEIVVRGRLSARLDAALKELAIKPRPGVTALSGDFLDQADLHDALDRLADFGLEVVSVDAVG
jgi:hypothetical protein